MGGRGGSLRGSQGMNAPTAIVRTVSKTPTPTAAAAAPAAPAAAAPAAAQAPAAAAPAAAQAPAAAPATPAKAQTKQQVSTPPTGVNGFAHLTPAQVSALEGAAKQAMRNDPALAAGIQDYTNPRQTANGKAFSQNANWALATGSRKLTKREQAMMDALDKLAKPVGTETTLYRADHDDFLQRLKVGNVQHMTNAQLRRALVGKAWTNNAPRIHRIRQPGKPLLAAAGRQPQRRQTPPGRIGIRQPGGADPVPHRQRHPNRIHPAQSV